MHQFSTFMSTGKKKSPPHYICSTLMSNQMGDFISLYMLSMLTFVIIYFSAFYINPQLSLGPKNFNINQKYSHKMILTNNEFNICIFVLIDHRLMSQIT